MTTTRLEICILHRYKLITEAIGLTTVAYPMIETGLRIFTVYPICMNIVIKIYLRSSVIPMTTSEAEHCFCVDPRTLPDMRLLMVGQWGGYR